MYERAMMDTAAPKDSLGYAATAQVSSGASDPARETIANAIASKLGDSIDFATSMLDRLGRLNARAFGEAPPTPTGTKGEPPANGMVEVIGNRMAALEGLLNSLSHEVDRLEKLV